MSKRTADQAQMKHNDVEHYIEYVLALSLCACDMYDDELRQRVHGPTVALTSTFTSPETIAKLLVEKIEARDRRERTLKSAFVQSIPVSEPASQ